MLRTVWLAAAVIHLAHGQAGILPTTPPTVDVSGLACHLDARYTLQPTPLNGKPHWATADGGSHVYWSTNGGTDPSWIIDDDTDDAEVSAYTYSGADIPPKTTTWHEFCDGDTGEQTSVVLQLNFGLFAANCAALAAQTLAQPSCAGVARHVSLGASEDPPCPVECALLWRDASALCDGKNLAAVEAVAPGVTDACAATAALATVLEETMTLATGQWWELSFPAVSGTRYEVHLRVGAGSGKTAPCTFNGEDDPVHGDGPGSCKANLAADSCGPGCQFSCVRDFCADCTLAHYCDLSCGFLCTESGITNTALYILPPGALESGQGSTETRLAVASQISQMSPEKRINFNAAATGTFTAQMFAHAGSGLVTLTVTELGTALERSPRLQADGLPHPVAVSCQTDECSFGYDGVTASDGDGSGFDLVVDAEAGRAYALLIELPPGKTAAQIEATFYQAAAAAGAAGFEPVVSGAMGEWSATPAPSPCITGNIYNQDEDQKCRSYAAGMYGYSCADTFCADCGQRAHHCDLACGFHCDHQSYAEQQGCSNEDRTCIGNIRASFGIHPDGAMFPRFLKGTWVAPASGPVLLRLVCNCDVVFYADVQAEGCQVNLEGSYGCHSNSDGTDNSACDSVLQLTVTQGAYFDQSTATATTQPVSGSVKRADTIVIGRAEAEAQAAMVWQATPLEHRTLNAPPTLDDMLVAGTAANHILASLFTLEQQPHLVYPLSWQLASNRAGEHRRLQMEGDHLLVSIETRAPSPRDADQAEQRLIDALPGAVRSEPHGTGSCDLTARSQAVDDECCDETTEDCSAGRPATCNVGCAGVVLPFFEDCAAALGRQAAAFDDVVTLCRAALGTQVRGLQDDPQARTHRELQTSGDSLHYATETHAVCGLGSTDLGCTTAGQTKRQLRLLIGRDDVEALSATLWQSGHEQDVGRRLQMSGDHVSRSTDEHAPTLDAMLVSGTPANALLTRMFIQEQQPQVAFPTGFALENSIGGGSHRRTQMEGDSLRVQIETHAATPAEAARIVQRLTSSTGSALAGVSAKDACNVALSSCVRARKASTGECLVCASMQSSTCTPASIDKFCGGQHP